MHALGKLLALVLLLAAPQRAAIDHIVRYVMGDKHVLGLSLAVVRDGHIVYAHGYGFSDRRRTLPTQAGTVFAIASLEKSFIAAVVLRLSERGHLRLTDSVCRYVPWYVNACDVRIADLLAHTSGIPDYAQLPGFDRFTRAPVSPESLVRRVASLPLVFAPGTRMSYSNTDYVLLGMIVQQITRMPLAAWLRRDLLTPLHLDATAGWNPFIDEPTRAQGSLPAGSPSLAFGAADLESSALDLARWIEDLFALRVVDARDVHRMFGGMGFFAGSLGGMDVAWHSGYIEGYSSYIAIVPSKRLGVVLLSNADEVDLGPLAESVIDDALDPPADPTPTAAPPADALILPLTGRRHRVVEPATLFHTLFDDFFLEDDATTYVQTGDIPAMWLRDSSAQTIPYIRFEPYFPVLQERTAGVIERDARNILTDPYANAFQSDYHVWERKWEVDSLAWPVLLTWVYWHTTGDRSIFTGDLHQAFRTIVSTYSCEEQHERCSTYAYPYRVHTNDAYAAGTGLIWGAFRPSDDPVHYRFNIPQNAIAAVALRELSVLAVAGYGDSSLARQATAIEERVQTGIERYGRVFERSYGGWMYVYETDGYGGDLLIDDANIPNLITLPYIGWCSANDVSYLNTRNFALSTADPYYYEGRYAQGLGSDHTPAQFVWPLGIIGRALTATSSLEVSTAITTLAQTDSNDGLIHESFYDNGYWRFTRSDFGWGNALYAELLFRALAGEQATPFIDPEVMLPFETRTQTPTLVPLVVQLVNESRIFGALETILRTGQAP